MASRGELMLHKVIKSKENSEQYESDGLLRKCENTASSSTFTKTESIIEPSATNSQNFQSYIVDVDGSLICESEVNEMYEEIVIDDGNFLTISKEDTNNIGSLLTQQVELENVIINESELSISVTDAMIDDLIPDQQEFNSSSITDECNVRCRDENIDSLLHDEELSNVTVKRKKRNKVIENEWTYKKAKIAREKGLEYKGRKLNEGKMQFVIDKPKREMKDIKCKCKSKLFNCSSLSYKDKEKLFHEFWSLSWKEKKMLVKGLTNVNVTQRARDRKEEGKSRRSLSFQYFFRIKHQKLRVCKATFLATLGIGEWMVSNWLKDERLEDDDVNDNSNVDNVAVAGKERKTERRTEELQKRHKGLTQFLESLPKVPSHYCRKTSKKLYLEPLWISKRQLYNMYSEKWCQEMKVMPLSTCSFYKAFDDLNLALYRPKKDQCDTCRSYKLHHIDESKYNEHVKRKEDARKEKEKDKKGDDYVFTMDLQSLLLCPKSNASALYYRCKLSVHNFTLFDLKTNDGFCYIWNETEGGLSANEFSSILDHFICSKIVDITENSKIILYSDGCNYQNRNVILSNTLLHLAKKHGITIQQKYLEKGHTQMECDSMHAVIERCLRNRDINVPADYVTVCREARKKKPYEVTYLDHQFFKDYSKSIIFKSIRPGKLSGDPKVTDLASLMYCQEGIFCKLNFDEKYIPLPVRKMRNTKEKIVDFPNLYDSRRKINKKKFDHLQELKTTIPLDFHTFYDCLPYNNY